MGSDSRSKLLLATICICTLLLVAKAAFLGFEAAHVGEKYKWKWMRVKSQAVTANVYASEYLDVPRIPLVPRSSHLAVLSSFIFIFAVVAAEVIRRLRRTRPTPRLSRTYFAPLMGVLCLQILGVWGYQRYQYSKG